MHRTGTPLHLWFWAAYLMTTPTPGLSAQQLQRQLGTGRYETAWMMLHELRRAMVNPQRERLRSAVEVDDCYVGGHEAGLRGGRARGTKALVLVAVEDRGSGSGRICLTVILDLSADTLTGFVQANVAAGATVHTDAWQGFKRLSRLGYDHRPNGQCAALAQAFYLDEYAFRFNRRRTQWPPSKTLLGLQGQHPPTTYRQSPRGSRQP